MYKKLMVKKKYFLKKEQFEMIPITWKYDLFKRYIREIRDFKIQFYM